MCPPASARGRGQLVTLSPNPWQVLVFIIGMCYGVNTFFTAAKVSLRSWWCVPLLQPATMPASGLARQPTPAQSMYTCNRQYLARRRPQIYIESYHSVPQGHCQAIVKYMAWTFFTSWVMFPILFVAGPEGLGVLSPYGSTIGHTIADLLSKNLWGLLGHHLRVKVRRARAPWWL